jgi:hypothetical protein
LPSFPSRFHSRVPIHTCYEFPGFRSCSPLIHYTTYLDDILIYSDTFEEHQKHINLVLEAFEKASFHLKPEKYKFHYQEAKYLGLIISIDSIKIDSEKITAI